MADNELTTRRTGWADAAAPGAARQRPKTAADEMRVVDLDPETVRVVPSLRQLQDAERAEWGDDWQDYGLVLTWQGGRPFSPEDLTRRFHGLVRRFNEDKERSASCSPSAGSAPSDTCLLSPDAYDKAIKAVEAASTPVVKQTDSTASLSKVIGQMRADGNWTIALDKEHKQTLLGKVLLDMMQALMSGHSDRHPGTPGYTPPSHNAAIAAVGLAVTLVQGFSSGAVIRRPTDQ